MTAFEHRGIVEGYYGKTYTPEDRLAWVRDIGRWGMNRYLYAPKDDPLHREHWRDPYPQETLDEFAACGSALQYHQGSQSTMRMTTTSRD
jgi:hyaluronoglucosaminidase